MNEENTKKLYEKHPELFIHATSTGSKRFYGFECGDGWFNLIDVLCNRIDMHIQHETVQRTRLTEYKKMVDEGKKDDIPTYFKHWESLNDIPEPMAYPVVQQIKEKFGELRFYAAGTDLYIETMIGITEALSVRTCETCGAPGTVGGKSWIRTLCPEHRAEADAPKVIG